jgi:hypothetical protein
MNKLKKQLLDFFDNSYGGDVPVHEGESFVHLSYEEAKSLLKSMDKKSFYTVKKKGPELTFQKTSDKQLDKESLLSMYDLLTLLEYAKKPKHAVAKKKLVSSGHKTSLFAKRRKGQMKKRGYNAKKQPRFDWNDHYLEGLRIHGNKDDAEAHADEMKRKILGKI